jgi:hypothetical protein
MGPESGSHKVTITPRRWHVRRSSQPIDRSLTRLEAGGFSSQTVSTSASVTFSQGVFPQMMSAPQHSGWMLNVARNLKAAGFPVDIAKLV